MGPLTRTVPRPGRKALKSDTRWTRRELWPRTQPACFPDLQTLEGWKGCSREALYPSPASAPAINPCCVRGVAGETRFGHPSAHIWAPKQPLAGEDGGRAGAGEAVLPNRRCQAVVGGEPSAAAQPASADTARHRWPGGLPNYQIKPSKHNVTPSILEGTFLDPEPQCVHLHTLAGPGTAAFSHGTRAFEVA